MTDFEKLLWALGYVRYLKHRVKSLEFEIGVLKSELSEAKYENGSERIRQLEQQNKALKTQWESRRATVHKRNKNQAEIIKRLQLENDNLRLNQK
jgi:predicted nuclease with TOPRIM domain